jgi:hypothetical protein
MGFSREAKALSESTLPEPSTALNPDPPASSCILHGAVTAPPGGGSSFPGVANPTKQPPETDEPERPAENHDVPRADPGDPEAAERRRASTRSAMRQVRAHLRVWLRAEGLEV